MRLLPLLLGMFIVLCLCSASALAAPPAQDSVNNQPRGRRHGQRHDHGLRHGLREPAGEGRAKGGQRCLPAGEWHEQLVEVAHHHGLYQR